MGWGTAWRRTGACVVLCAAAALADNLRGGAASQVGDAVGEAARELGSSHDVCYKILDTWWADREGLKVRGEVSAMDVVCKTLSGQPLLCNSVDERKAAMASGALTFTAEQMAARCTTVGAHDTSCVANPCNSVNTGDCHLQGSQGQCVWWEGDRLEKYNSWLKSQAMTPLPQHGCYRNPCNLPGLGTQVSMCAKRSVPGLFECTWCKGTGDKLLVGKGMGCQMTTPNTTASCAPVNSKNVKKSTIMMSIVNNRCQCTTDTSLCSQLVDASRGGFMNRFKTGANGKSIDLGKLPERES